MGQATESQQVERHAFVKNIDGVRYQVKDVARSGRQIQIEDPDGNPIELFEPAR
jgi:hypothetical protein